MTNDTPITAFDFLRTKPRTPADCDVLMQRLIATADAAINDFQSATTLWSWVLHHVRAYFFVRAAEAVYELKWQLIRRETPGVTR